MTFDREPDLDNANVGMPVITWRILRKLSEWGASFFIACKKLCHGRREYEKK